VLVRAAIVVIVALVAIGTARAEQASVALLPLDADKRLELYGQPVAGEMSRALVAGGIDVVVVGPKMSVPERAKLIVDGSIKSKGDEVVLTIRVRETFGREIDKLQETATNLATIDRAASKLSARLLPIVKQQLAALATKQPDVPVIEPRQPTPPPPPPSTVLVGIAGDITSQYLRGGFTTALQTWGSRQRQWQVIPVDPAALVQKIAPDTVSRANAKHAIAFEILDYQVFEARRKEALGDKIVPLATARVRVRVADRDGVKFERVVVTDTIVGDPLMQLDALGARVAAEVLAILRPHLRRVEASWR
jgi:hypothetical protein